MTKKQYVFGAVLGVAACALAVDQFGGFGRSAGETGAADARLVAAKPRVTKQGPTTAPVAPAEVRNGLAVRLETVAKAQDLNPANVGDAFAADESWAPPAPVVEVPVVVAKPDVEAEAELARRTKFAHDHKLTAVMKTSTGGVAVIDGRMLRQGQALAGFELLKVSERSATFRRGDNQVELKLQASGGGSPVATADR